MSFVTRFVGTNLDFLMDSLFFPLIIHSWLGSVYILGQPRLVHFRVWILISSDLELCRPRVWLT